MAGVADRGLIFAGASSVIAIALAIVIILMFVFLMKTAWLTLLANTDAFHVRADDGSEPPAFGIQGPVDDSHLIPTCPTHRSAATLGGHRSVYHNSRRKLASPVAFVDLLAAVLDRLVHVGGGIVFGSSGIINGLRRTCQRRLDSDLFEDPSWSSATDTVYLASRPGHHDPANYHCVNRDVHGPDAP